MKKPLAEYRRSIKRELRFSGPYSHNIIGLHLTSIDEHYGLAEANKAIRDFKLDKMGWSVREEK